MSVDKSWRRGASLALAIALAIAASLLRPRDAFAQCGAPTSSCRICHEHEAGGAIFQGNEPWHEDHAFGDFCAVCHGGHPEAGDATAAHIGKIPPLSGDRASCASCHGASAEDLAQRYAARRRIAEPALPAPAAPAPPDAPARRGPDIPDLVLALLVLGVGGAGVRYVVRNERRLRAPRRRGHAARAIEKEANE